MPKYQVQRSAYYWLSIEVEADNEDEAQELGEQLIADGHYTSEEFGDWTSDQTYVDEIEEFVYVPEPPKEEPDLVY